MAGYIIPIGTGREGNWILARDNSIWALVKNYRIEEGDDLFFWQSGHGLIAHAHAATDSTPVVPGESLPWPDHVEMKHAWKFPLEVLAEPDLPVETRRSEIRNLLGNRDIPNKPALRIDTQRIPLFIGLFAGSSEQTDSAWLALSAGDDRQHGGNDGYGDTIDAAYQWDETVPNHGNLKVGDFIVLWDKHMLLGASIIDRIVTGTEQKARHTCSHCGSSKLQGTQNKISTFQVLSVQGDI